MNHSTLNRAQSGLSLIELMVAIAIGLMLMLGLTTTFKNSSDTQREIERSGRLIENGRYAVDMLATELHHAGFFGYYYEPLAAPAALPDPCEITSLVNLQDALAMPMQGYAAPDLATRPDISATSCDDKGLFTNANLSPGSDIFTVRRASTDVFTGNPTAQEVYIQANARAANILFGNASANVPVNAADNTAQTLKKHPHDAASVDWADTHEFHVNTYFVAPCSFGSGADGQCAAGDDAIPTLKRLELSSVGGVREMSIVPLVEGVEFMKVSYGIDTSPATVHPVTGFSGDGVPDSYVATPALAQWPQVVAVRVYLLVSATEPTQGFTDTKQYSFTALGLNLGPFNDAFKRHVFSTEVRPMNLAGRREIP